MHDPRNGLRISERDIRALTFIGEGYEVAQYQLHAAIFPNVSAVVVSHFVRRAVRNGWIAIERWNRVGINRLRLTARGRQVVVRAGGDPVALFVPKKAVASKDVAHTLWINDVRVALLSMRTRFDAMLPAWQLQRRFVPPPTAIPDILAIRGGEMPLIVACEVDLGGERLRTVFLPKLLELQTVLTRWAEGGRTITAVFTTSDARIDTIGQLAKATAADIRAARLPSASGPVAVAELANVMNRWLATVL